MTDGVGCTCTLPLRWRAGSAANPAALLTEAQLLLTAFNHLESQPEGGVNDPAAAGDPPRLARLEAKLDLALYLLARTLAPRHKLPLREVWLSSTLLTWPDPAPPAAGEAVLIELQPCASLPLPLTLPGVALAADGAHARVALASLPEPLSEALHQFVFRRHRQDIRQRLLARAAAGPDGAGAPGG